MTELKLDNVTGVRWRDEGGTVYERTIHDGEIEDVPVGQTAELEEKNGD
jgi:hypothetical protein